MATGLTDELKSELVESVKDAWKENGYYLLQAKPTNEMFAEEIRKAITEYVDNDKWWELTQEQKDEVMVDAITHDCSL